MSSQKQLNFSSEKERTNSKTSSTMILYESVFKDAMDSESNVENDEDMYLEVKNIRIKPRRLVFTNPFEGKVFQENITIRNGGIKPVFIRILPPTSSGIHLKTIMKGVHLCSGMIIKRLVTYKVQMMTLVSSCRIPIYINDEDIIHYPIRIYTTPICLRITPCSVLDFGKVDASRTPVKIMFRVLNMDVKPTRFFIDLSPNELELTIEPPRGILMGEQEIEFSVSAIFKTPGRYQANFCIITEIQTFMSIKADVGSTSILPSFLPHTTSFAFVQFPITYYGTTVVRNIIMVNQCNTQSFFCVLGEVELKTFTLKELRRTTNDYNCFNILPEEGRLLPNDIRVFQLTYTPILKKDLPSKSYHLVMMRIIRLKLKDLNPSDYPDSVFEDPLLRTSTSSNIKRPSDLSSFSSLSLSDSQLELKTSHMSDADRVPAEARLMIYGQVEKVAVTITPDALDCCDLEVDKTTTRVLRIQNDCSTLPIIFEYQKIAFIEVDPKIEKLKPLESIEVTVSITPRSFDPIQTKIVFELLHYSHTKNGQELTIIGVSTVNLNIIQKIASKSNKPDALLVKNFKFVKANQRPKSAVMEILTHSDNYIGLPDDRPKHNLPDFLGRKFRTIYAALPRYQPNFNEYALTARDKQLLKAKNHYNAFIRMKANKLRIKKHQKPPVIDSKEKCVMRWTKSYPEKKSDNMITNEFIPLTPIQLVLIDIQPRSIVVENVAFNSTYIHTLKVTNKTNTYLKIYLRSHKEKFQFFNGQRFTILPNSEKDLSFMININALPIYNYELDVIINNCFVVATSALVKACPKRLTLSTDMIVFRENEGACKFIELRNELNVNIPFYWKAPSVFKVDPQQGNIVSGRFVACLITFVIGKAENMAYELGLHTDNKHYNLKVLIESTDYKVKIPKVLSFDDLALNALCLKNIPMTNMSGERLRFNVLEEHLPDGFKVRPKEGFINPWSTFNLAAIANSSQIGKFKFQIEIMVVHKKITCEVSGNVIFPELKFQPETLRFRKMAASSFDIVCVSVINTSNVTAYLQFDTDRYPELSYSEYTNTEYFSNKDVLTVDPKTSKKFSIHFYPFNPLVTSFPLPLIINKISTGNKSKTILMSKPTIKVHAQVLSYKLEVKTWKYNFTYFPHYGYKNVTSQIIKIKNPCKNLVTFCIRLDELSDPFTFKYKEGARTINYNYSYVVDLEPDEVVVFEATFLPIMPGNHNIRLPVFIRDDFNQDIHNYLYFVGTYPEATYKFTENEVHFGFIPLNLTIVRKVIIDMAYHHPDCNCIARIDDSHIYVDVDPAVPRSINSFTFVSITFNSSRPHLLNCKLELVCECPGPNLEIKVFGGCENNYFTNHSCIQYFKYTSALSLTTIFDTGEETRNTSTNVTEDGEKEEAFKHNFTTDLPYFQSGTKPFDDYMREVVAIVEKWLTEQIFFGVKSYTIPDTICMPDIKHYEKQGKQDAIIKLPLIHIMNYLLGPVIMAPFELKYSEKKPIWLLVRKFYRDFLNYLLTLGCFVNMIKPEALMPYEMYCQYITNTDQKQKLLSARTFYLLSKQCWLDLLLQSYKVLIFHRILQYLVVSPSSLKALNTLKSITMSSSDVINTGHGDLPIATATIYSEESLLLLMWINKHFQDRKPQFASAFYGNQMTESFRLKKIENFDSDLSDSLGIMACLLNYCPFLEDYLIGIYAPATNRMEMFNNAYILINALSLLQVSFKLQPNDIIEPNTLQMLMFLTYLYDFLLPLKPKETIVFNSVLSQSKVETITICNDSNHKMYYKIYFFNNTDDLFSTEETQIIIDQDHTCKLKITYCARFLREQKTVLLLSGEIPGYQYSNSKIYYLEGHPELANAGMPPIQLKTLIYNVKKVTFDIQSPYQQPCVYDIFVVNQECHDVSEFLGLLIPYENVLKTKALVRCKFSSAFAEADEHGKISLSADMCSIVNTSYTQWVLFREKTVGDFMAKIEITTKPMKKASMLKLKMQKNLSEFPCTCFKKIGDVTNNKCPRNAKLMIPSQNEYIWNSVLELFLACSDPEDGEFWNVFGNTTIGSHIVERILFDHKRFLTDDMSYFMNKTFTYNVRTKSPEAVVTQKIKIIQEASPSNTETEILIHFNEIVKSFYLILDSVDEKETRTYKVRVNYE